MVQKKGNAWYVTLWEKDPSGKRRKKWIALPDVTTEKAAKKAERQLLAAKDAGTYVPPSRLTVGEFLDQWLTGIKDGLAPRTWETYRGWVNNHLKREVGSIPLTKLTADEIRAAYGRLLDGGRHKGEGGLSRQSVLHCHRVLKEALKQAVLDNRIVRNPADGVKPPKVERPEMTALDEGQTAALLDAAEGTALHVPVVLAACTGMRLGEILGLRWEDVDLQGGTLSVRQAVQQTREKGVCFKQPKTAKSRRTVALPSLVVQVLRSHREQTGRVAGLVVCHEEGSPLSPTAFTKRFAALLKREGLPHVRFHDLRHSHATQLLRQGVNVKVVSERLGHSTISITLDTYSHVLPGMQEDAARGFDAALRTAMEGRRTGTEGR
jgi:integrase